MCHDVTRARIFTPVGGVRSLYIVLIQDGIQALMAETLLFVGNIYIWVGVAQANSALIPAECVFFKCAHLWWELSHGCLSSTQKVVTSDVHLVNGSISFVNDDFFKWARHPQSGNSYKYYSAQSSQCLFSDTVRYGTKESNQMLMFSFAILAPEKTLIRRRDGSDKIYWTIDRKVCHLMRCSSWDNLWKLRRCL